MTAAVAAHHGIGPRAGGRIRRVPVSMPRISHGPIPTDLVADAVKAGP
jgi:hypothetical protein